MSSKGKELCAAQQELAKYQETCKHQWGEHKEKMLFSDTVFIGSYLQKKRFSRTCLECGKTEYTEAFKAEYHPIFGPQGAIE